MGFPTDGRTVAVASELVPISLFDADTAASGPVLRGARGTSRFVGFAKQQLVAAGDDGILRIWNPRDGTLVRLPVFPDDGVGCHTNVTVKLLTSLWPVRHGSRHETHSP